MVVSGDETQASQASYVVYHGANVHKKTYYVPVKAFRWAVLSAKKNATLIARWQSQSPRHGLYALPS